MGAMGALKGNADNKADPDTHTVLLPRLPKPLKQIRLTVRLRKSTLLRVKLSVWLLKLSARIGGFQMDVGQVGEEDVG